jgi:hypothetical protein
MHTISLLDSYFRKEPSKGYTDWIVEMSPDQFRRAIEIVKQSRNALISEDHTIQNLVFWYINPNRNCIALKCVFRHHRLELTIAKLLTLGIYPVPDSQTLEVKTFLVLLSVKDEETNIEAKLHESLEGSFRFDPNHNSWVFTMDGVMNSTKLHYQLMDLAWISNASVFYLHTVPKALSVESPFLYAWSIGEDIYTAKTSISVNRIIKQRVKEAKNADYVITDPYVPEDSAILGELNAGWSFSNFDSTNIEGIELTTLCTKRDIKCKLAKTNYNAVRIKPTAFKENSYVFKDPKDFAKDPRNFIRSNYVISVQMSNLQGLHDAFINLLYPWKRPLAIDIYTLVYINDRDPCQFFLVNKRVPIDLAMVYSIVSEWGQVTQIDEGLISVLPTLGNLIPLAIAHRKKTWIVQFQYVSDAETCYKTENLKSPLEPYHANPYVVLVTNREEYSKQYFECYGSVVQFRKLTKKVTPTSECQDCLDDYYVSNYLATKLVMIHLEMIDIVSKLEYYLTFIYHVPVKLKPRHINWGTIYTLFSTKELTSILKEYAEFSDVIELTFEVNNYSSDKGAFLTSICQNINYLVKGDLPCSAERLVKFFEFDVMDVLRSAKRCNSYNILTHIIRTYPLAVDWNFIIESCTSNLSLFNQLINQKLVPEHHLAQMVGSLLSYEDSLASYFIPNQNYLFYQSLVKLYQDPSSRAASIKYGIPKSRLFADYLRKLQGHEVLSLADLPLIMTSIDCSMASDNATVKWLTIAPNLDLTKFKELGLLLKCGTCDKRIKRCKCSSGDLRAYTILAVDPLNDNFFRARERQADCAEITQERVNWDRIKNERDLNLAIRLDFLFMNFDA